MIEKLSLDNENFEWIISRENVKKSILSEARKELKTETPNEKEMRAFFEYQKRHSRDQQIKDEFPVELQSYMLMHADRTGDALTRIKRGIVNESIFSYLQLAQVIEILKRNSRVSNVYCFYQAMYLADFFGDDGNEQESLAYHCSLDDVNQLTRMKENDFMPTYWWAEDCSWFFEHDMDSGYALIGGSWKLLDALREVTPVFVQILGSFPVKDIGRFYDLFEENFEKYYSKK